MRTIVLASLLLAAALAGWFLLPQRPQPFGRPIVIAGRRVSDHEFQRWLLYGPCRSRLEARKTWFLIEIERERIAARVAASEIEAREKVRPFASDVERANAMEAARTATRQRLAAEGEVTLEELELEYSRAVEEFLRKHPRLDLEAEIGRSFRRSDWFREELRLGLAFDKTFFPGVESGWPTETWAALELQALEQRDARDQSRKSVRDSIPEHDWRALRWESPDALAEMRDTVRRWLLRRTQIETAVHGLRPELVMVAYGGGDGCLDHIVRTDELWDEVADAVEPWEIEAARDWLGTALAVRTELEARGGTELEALRENVISDLQARAESEGMRLDELAARSDRFPSPEAWVDYNVLLEAYRPRVADELARALDQEAERSSWVRHGARVHVEVLLVSAVDIARHRWLPDGMERARAKANDLKRRIEANVRAWSIRRPGEREAVEPFVFWNRLLETESEWWDPPDPREGDTPRQPRNRGRFYGRTWSELRMLLSESDATDWSRGTRVTEHVFFDQRPGTIDGPFPCALGWVLVRLGAREPPPTRLDVSRDRELVLEDALRASFARFARAARARAGIEAAGD